MKKTMLLISVLVIGLFMPMRAISNTYIHHAIKKEVLAVFNIDSKGVNLDPTQLGNLVRMAAEKSDQYSVFDRYDMIDFMENKNLDYNNCYGKSCLVKLGKNLKVERILTGSVEKYYDKIVITLRLINVNENSVQKTNVEEYLNLEKEIPAMLEFSVQNLFGIETDKAKEMILKKEFNYESATVNPDNKKITNSGPRMGLAYVTGENGRRIRAPKKEGGFDSYPIMTQFGYQHEIQYLNEGTFQALFEIIPIITGIDQGLFIPSIAFMNGFRSSLNGWEFAFGPVFSVSRNLEGYYDDAGKFQPKSSLPVDEFGVTQDSGQDFVIRKDVRGKPQLTSSFVWAVGRTFKSGHLNVPVNLFVSPDKNGWHFGLNFGFNSKDLGF